MDRRQRKNRKAITDAFVELMLQRRYDKVTVAEIIERADIARSTFYAHFETKDELLRSLCEEMFDHIFCEISSSPVPSEGKSAEKANYAGLRGKLVHLLFHLRENHEGLCAKLISEGEPCYTRYFEDRLADMLIQGAACEERPNEFAIGFLVSGFTSAVRQWYKEGCALDPDELIERVESASLESLYLKTKPTEVKRSTHPHLTHVFR